jgi:elongation factor Tu
MKVDGVYSIRNIGVLVTGKIKRGVLHIDDELHVLGKDSAKKIIIGGIFVNHKQVNEASSGMQIEIQLPKLEKEDIKRGDILTG